MLDKKNFISFNFLKKESYTGSMKGMRFRLSKEEEGTKLKAVIWPEPYSFDATKEELKQSEEFEFSKAGEDKAVDWLNEQYISQKKLWDSVNHYN